MRPTVARNFMAFACGSRKNLRMLSYHFAEHKEGDLHMMRSEYIEQFRRKRCAWSVVEGHGDVRTVHVHRIKGNWRFLRRSGSFYRSLLFYLWRCGWLRRRFNWVDGFSAPDYRRSLGR